MSDQEGKSGLDQLAGAMMVKSKDLKDIWEDVKENHRKLDSCPGPHDFVVKNPEARRMNQRMVCRKCKGEMTVLDANLYLKGVAHGVKSVRALPRLPSKG